MHKRMPPRIKDVLVAKCDSVNRLFGFFEVKYPITVINDPELVKQVTVKDFDYFVNHRNFVTPENEPLFANSLFISKDQTWRDMRATLSPAFIGSKMRLIYGLLEEVCQTAMVHLTEKANKKPLDIDFKDFATRYTHDVIASTAFGVRLNAIQEIDNDFYLLGKKATNFSGWTCFKIFLFSNCRPIMNFFKLRLFDQKFGDYFNDLILGNIEYRIENGIYRPDTINLLIEARKGALKKMQQKKEGFDAVSVSICFCAHELMENPDIQERLIAEFDEVNDSMNGRPATYQAVPNMKYMDMVVSETLRKWPPVIAGDRVCGKPHEFVDETTGGVVKFEVGDPFWVPVLRFHYNPEYFPNPTRFDPERFSDENKDNIKPFTYLPFGTGPRNCIGYRFALMEINLIMFCLMSHFTFEPSEKNSDSSNDVSSNFPTSSKGWLPYPA